MADRRPRLSRAAREGPSADPADASVARLIEEYLAAVDGGKAPDREQFLAGHPDVAARLRDALRGLDLVRLAANQFEQAAEGVSDPPRELLGDFRLIREVGRGGMGVVYEAEQISLDRRVALKVLPFAAVLDDRQLQRFKHEAQAAALLHHTNIVPVYTVGTERGVHYYAMEFVEGRTLAAVFQELRETRREGEQGEGRPSSDEARALTSGGGTGTPQYCRAVARLGVQAAEALDHAHEQGVVHRDIKPANLMVDGAGRVRITDFGLARSSAHPQLTRTGAIVGTLGYMSPEQALAKRVPVDHRTDVYSLGVTLHEMLTLEYAFTGEDPRQVIHDIAFKEPAPPRRLNPAVPPALETIVLKAVAKDPESRFESAREMAEDLRRFLADQPIRAKRAPLIDRASLWVRRHRIGVAAAACVLVIAVAALAVDSVRGAAARRRIQGALDDSRESAKRAEAALVESRAQTARADASLAKARAAIDRMLTQVGGRHLRGIPGFEDVRRKVLEEALTLCEELRATAGDDPRIRLDIARVMHLVAGEYESMGDLGAAERMSVRALAELATLAPETGPWHPALWEVKRVERLRAQVCTSASRHREAADCQAHAVALAERGVREASGDSRGAALHDLASQLVVQSVTLFNVERETEAEQTLRRALDLFDSARAEAATDPHDRAEFLQALLLAAARSDESGHAARAEELLRRALRLSASDIDSPADSFAFETSTQSHAAAGAHFLRNGRVEDALAATSVAVAASARAASEFPRYPMGLLRAAECRGIHAAVLARAGRAEEAGRELTDARGRFDGLLTGFPNSDTVRDHAAGSLEIVGNSLTDAGCFEQADAVFRRAADLRRALAAAAPGEGPKSSLSRTLANWSRRMYCQMAEERRLDLTREAVRSAEEARGAPDASARSRSSLLYALGVLGRTLYDADRFEEAAKILHRSVDVAREQVADERGAPGVRRRYAEAVRDWGDALRCARRRDEAAAALSEALGLLEGLANEFPKSTVMRGEFCVALNMMATLEWNRGRFDEAEAFVKRAIGESKHVAAVNPGPIRVLQGNLHTRLGEIQLSSGRPGEAERSLQRAHSMLRECDASNLEAMKHRALCCGLLSEILQRTPREAEAERWLRECIEEWTRVAAADPSSPGHHESLVLAGSNYAIFLMQRSRFADMERVVRRAIELGTPFAGKGSHPHLRGRIADMHTMLAAFVLLPADRVREAMDACERGLELWPGRSDLLSLRIRILADGADPALRDPARAVSLAREALAGVSDEKPEGQTDEQVANLSMKPGDGWACLGHALVCDGRWEEGIAAYEKAWELGREDHGDDWLNEALAHARLGHREEAVQLLESFDSWRGKELEKQQKSGPRTKLEEVGADGTPVMSIRYFDEQDVKRWSRRRAEVEKLLRAPEAR